MFHPLVAGDFPLPERFTYPFCYTPHPLCVMAAGEVQRYLQGRPEWQAELRDGKMFGVLVVRTGEGEIGFLAAFSGMLAGSNRQEYFVPPVYDLQSPGGFFKAEEERITAINREIEALEGDAVFLAAQAGLEEEQWVAGLAIGCAKMQMQREKMERDRRRQAGLTPAEEEALVRESQHGKAELKRLKERCHRRVAMAQAVVEEWQGRIDALKAERHKRSAALQQRLFGEFRILNARGEEKDLCTLFREAGREEPPAGAGECAAPRLLQYAYRQGWKPLAMAEFWWGASPRSELRRHGYYYPACKGKCEPILRHALLGLEVEENPLAGAEAGAASGALGTGMEAEEGNGITPGMEPEVLWEDAWVVALCKPAGMLTVPGKEALPSVEEWLRRRYPSADGPLIVHRLDMATSGVLLAAKTKKAHGHLQAQFASRQVEKRYIALLDGVVASESGTIDLPLCLDPDDRPRQMVSVAHGKPAVTRYEVLGHTGGRTRVAFYPLTGRTHQLRVHAAHPEGLDAPILGDTLYGRAADRLYLHAELLVCRHPVTGEMLKVEKPAGF